MVGWINQFQDSDQVGAFMLMEINFRVLIMMVSVLSMYPTISFWRTVCRRRRDTLMFSCFLGVIRVWMKAVIFAAILCCTPCSTRCKCTILVPYTNCHCVGPCFRRFMFHEFGTSSNDVTAITGFVQIIQAVWENKRRTHTHINTGNVWFRIFCFMWRTVKWLKYSNKFSK